MKLESQSHYYLLEMKCCRHPVNQYVQNFNLVDTTIHAIDATESLKIAKTNFKTSLSYFSQNCKVHTFSSMGQIQIKVLITLPFFCFLYYPQRSWGKVMFLQASAILSTVGCVHGWGGACMGMRHAWVGGMHDWGCAWLGGMCGKGGMRGKGECVW